MEQPSSASLVCRRSPGRHLTPHEPITTNTVAGMDPLETVAPAFVDMAHQIVWATAATVNGAGEPTHAHPAPDLGVGRRRRSRGWIATSPSVAQGQASGAQPDDVVELLAAEPRHVHASVPHVVGRHAGRARGAVGALQRGARTRRLRARRSSPAGTSPVAAGLRCARTRARRACVSWRAAGWSAARGCCSSGGSEELSALSSSTWPGGARG